MSTEATIELGSASHISAKQKSKLINFFYSAPEAAAVYLIGDFNGWNPNAHPLRRRDHGWWSLQVRLEPGHHEYLFVVDGIPKLDPHATGTTRNARYKSVSLVAVS